MSLIYGNSLQCDGTTQYARNTAGGSTVTNNYSMTAWVYIIAYGAGNTFLFQNGANDARGMALYISSTGKLQADYAFVVNVDSAFSLNLAQWYHIGLIRNAGTSQLYVNGIAKGSTVANAPNSGGDYITIGAWTSSGGTTSGFANVKLDDVRFYERAITATEMLSLYNNGDRWPFTDISSTSLKYWYKLDESSGNPADSSGNAITLTNFNTATFVTGIVATGGDKTGFLQFFGPQPQQ